MPKAEGRSAQISNSPTLQEEGASGERFRDWPSGPSGHFLRALRSRPVLFFPPCRLSNGSNAACFALDNFTFMALRGRSLLRFSFVGTVKSKREGGTPVAS